LEYMINIRNPYTKRGRIYLAFSTPYPLSNIMTNSNRSHAAPYILNCFSNWTQVSCLQCFSAET
jgi:hypothetical protein